MIKKNFQRSHLRSPMKSRVVFSLGNKVGMSHTINISRGGLLVNEIEGAKVGDKVWTFIELVILPTFSEQSEESILSIDEREFEKEILSIKFEIVRIFDGPTQTSDKKVSQMGTRFDNIDTETQKTIDSYVETFKKNVVYLLTLIERLGRSSGPPGVFKKVANLLGYNPEEKIALLRQKVLHDYQSLEGP